MNTFSRAERVGGLIQQTVSEILHRQIKDPRLEMATITHVKMTRDLKIARIYFVVPGGEKMIVRTERRGQDNLLVNGGSFYSSLQFLNFAFNLHESF